ncbi:cupredoxin domain-containing protein [Brumicola blandensis]|uniref:Cupredoxin domain-containing protein n=1 Tax=Brumicola blandensis TaxID=3075611 RepID=A0AAW8R9L6_9ALTE|nr:cupredoxin domain-containing protein [Alteromonas sp. W409]MDT0583888.1 cupredoxin domain-containing protein [Alteromonas sp. W409]
MLAILLNLVCLPLHARQQKLVEIELQNHIFQPSTIIVPANQKIKFVIYNRDNTPEEFDSFDLNREKVIFPNAKATLFVGPLPAGEYEFFGEYHPETAIGKVIVRKQEGISIVD